MTKFEILVLRCLRALLLAKVSSASKMELTDLAREISSTIIEDKLGG